MQERNALYAQVTQLTAQQNQLEQQLRTARTHEAFGGRNDSELLAQIGRLEADLEAANLKKKDLRVQIASLESDLEDAQAKAARK